MVWFRKSVELGGRQEVDFSTWLLPSEPGCQQVCHLHNEWLPSESDFRQQVGLLWDGSGAEASALFSGLARSNDHIGFSSAAINFFLELKPSEARWVYNKLKDAGVEFNESIRRQLKILGELETFLLYERLASLADLTAASDEEVRQCRFVLSVLISASFFARIDQQFDLVRDLNFIELSKFLQKLRTLAEVFPAGRHTPCDESVNLLPQDLTSQGSKLEDTVDKSEVLFETISKESKQIGTKYYFLSSGAPLRSDTNREIWLETRRRSISATDARALVKLNGLPSAQRERLMHDKIHRVSYDFESFELGIEREPVIADWVARNFPEEQFVATYLLYAGQNDRHVATPDMIGVTSLCEIKVSTKPLRTCKTTYRDQLQWQMHVTGASRVLLAVENRHTQEIEAEWISRDDERIKTLVAAANSFLSEFDQLVQVQEENEFEEDDEYFDEEDQVELHASRESEVDYSARPELQDIPEYEELYWNEMHQALTLYCQGHSVSAIADHLERPTNDVVGSLGMHIFSIDGELVNPNAKNFRVPWSADSYKKLAALLRLGKGVDEICEELGRDRLGVLYKLFERSNPVVPPIVLEVFEVAV